MVDQNKSHNRKKHIGIKYGIITIAVYALVFYIWWILLPSSILEVISGSMAWFVIFQLMPFLVAFLFLITGYSALKGDKAQIFPAIVHGVVLSFLISLRF